MCAVLGTGLLMSCLENTLHRKYIFRKYIANKLAQHAKCIRISLCLKHGVIEKRGQIEFFKPGLELTITINFV